MYKLTSIFIISGCLLSAATDEDKLKTTERELKFAKFDSLFLQEQLLKKQLEDINRAKQELYSQLCKAEGLPADTNICIPDFEKKTVTEKKPEVKTTK